jgi:hypothetical protein
MNIAKLFAPVAVISLGFLGLASDASADAAGFKVKIDCHGTNGLPTWSETTNNVKIIAYVNGYPITLRSPAPVTPAQCNVEDGITVSYAAFSAPDVDKIIVSIDGSDAFWMDNVTLVNYDGKTEKKWGVENNVGYCISTNSADGANAYCLDGKSPASKTFTP